MPLIQTPPGEHGGKLFGSNSMVLKAALVSASHLNVVPDAS